MRLAGRGQDSDEVIERRLAGSLDELSQHVNFDYVIVNDVFERALHELEAIIIASRLTLSQQSRRQSELLTRLLNHSAD